MNRFFVRFLTTLALVLSSTMLFGQSLSWSTPTAAVATVGGDNQRNGVALAVFKNQVWIAYTSTYNCTGADCYVEIGHNSGGSSTTFSFNFIPNPTFTEGYVVSSNNPALAKVVVNGAETLFMLFRDSFGSEFLLSTTDGTNWNPSTGGSPWVINTGTSTVYGPTLAVNPSDSTKLYAGFMNGTTFNPVICSIPISNPNSPSCQNYTNLRTMNFQPGLAFWNGLLYMAYEDRGNSHCLYGYTINVSTNAATTWNPIGCNQQTSTAPSLATHNGYLYVAYRSNDSSQKFTVLVSTNGSDLGNRMQPGWSMGGPPALVDLNQLSPSVNAMMNGFAKSGTGYVSIGQ